MTLAEIQRKLNHLKEKGFIPSLRRGPTGIGYTLEKELGLKESNVAIPDIGGRVELKASRKEAASLITLFTFNRGVWQIPQKKVIENYGYIDENRRPALYSTVWVGQENSLGLSISLDETNNRVNLIHSNSNTLIAVWNVYILVSKFVSKLERLIFVLADSQLDENNKEKFHFNEAYLLEEPTPESFLEAFKNSKIGIDVRMHLKPNNTVRNHGTGIRIHEQGMPALFGKKRELIYEKKVKDVFSIVDESRKYVDFLPLYSLQAAAGKFGEGQAVEEEGWIKADIGRKLGPNMFVAKVVGHSMEPKIKDGDLCVFRANVAGTRQGKIVLAQARDIEDSETGGSYTIKLYSSRKKIEKDGTWRHTEITLNPLNPTYKPMVLKDVAESDFKIIAEFIGNVKK